MQVFDMRYEKHAEIAMLWQVATEWHKFHVINWYNRVWFYINYVFAMSCFCAGNAMRIM